MSVSPLRRIASLGLVLCVLAAPASARARRDPNATELKTVFLNKPAPDFLFDVGEGQRRLSQLAGRPVVVNFWDTWCEPCQAELGAFAKIAPAYGETVGVLTVNDEAHGTALRYLADHGFTLPVVEDPARQIFSLYSIFPIPVTVIVSRGGTVSKVIVGEMDWNELHADIDAELAPPAAPTGAPQQRQ